MQTSSFDDWLTRPLRTGSENVETEKLRILKMLEERKITAEEAARLLEALDRVGARPTERELKRRWVHIRVEKDGDETVNVKVPLALLKLGFRLAPHALAGGRGALGDLDIDIEKILEMAQEEGFDGKLLEVYDEEEDKRVTIRLE